jgi:hypothetical protein
VLREEFGKRIVEAWSEVHKGEEKVFPLWDA